MAIDNTNKEHSFKDYADTCGIDSKNVTLCDTNIHVSSPDEMIQNRGKGPSAKHNEPVATSTKQLMGYVTVRNIETETSYKQEDWSKFVLKELMDNAYDWLNACYPSNEKNKAKNKENRKIGTRIWITTDSNNNRFVHIAIRNSNVDNEPVFIELRKIFDYKSWYSTKRYQHQMTAGSLGDALKRCLGMGYASWTSDYNPDETFEDNPEWNEPIIIRCNGYEFKVFINVDTSLEDIWTEVVEIDRPSRDIGTDTEVEVTLPLPKNSLDNRLVKLKEYYEISKIAKRKISFDFYCPEGI